MNINEMKEEFIQLYGDGGEMNAFFAPGRVNLIGEHTDYNGGHVFPCALTVGTYGLVRRRDDDLFRLCSCNFRDTGIASFTVKDLLPGQDKGWTAYPKGVIWAFGMKDYHFPSGADMLIWGDVPRGSGLSSSASLEVLTSLMLRDTFGFNISMEGLALIGQFAENNFNGINCGIMDQFASAMGKKGNAIFLDTDTLSYEYAPVKMDDISLIVTNSNVKHSLVNSEYNTRRRQCEAALHDLQTVVDIKYLCDLSPEEYEEYRSAISDPIAEKRSRHVIYENARCIEAADVLKHGDMERFGQLMNESHISQRDDFEVSCPEMDILVSEAWDAEGCIGSRLTGGGFGGCSVSLVRSGAVEKFIEKVGAAYTEGTGLTAQFYIMDIADGAHRLR